MVSRGCWHSVHLPLFFFTWSPATHDVNLAVRMHVSISGCLSDVHQENLNPLPRPSQSTLAKQLVRPRSKTKRKLLLEIPAHLFQEWISGPRIVWHLVNVFMNIDIACALHPRHNALGCIHWSWRNDKLGSFL
jgi:hypothetical protein